MAATSGLLRTAGFVIWRTRQLLAAEGSEGLVPSQRTLYRLFARLSQGQHDIDAQLVHAAARPVIVPETIVCDHGKAFLSHAFRVSCRFLRIDLQPARKAMPTDKPHVERTIASVGTLFAQYLAGYVGRGVEHRGQDVTADRLWTLREAQDLLDEWIVTVWQNRPHDGLRDPHRT
jgi:hypothetical protein